MIPDLEIDPNHYLMLDSSLGIITHDLLFCADEKHL